MRRFLLALSAIALVPLGGLALAATTHAPADPILPQSVGGTIDLGAIPVQPVAGHLAVSGAVADDESDDMPAAWNKRGRNLVAIGRESDDGVTDGEEREAD